MTRFITHMHCICYFYQNLNKKDRSLSVLLNFRLNLFFSGGHCRNRTTKNKILNKKKRKKMIIIVV